jgi:NADPH:quinone reductase-like Zn-dependent oxidoreductase
MKANRIHRFGGPEVITFEETAVPLPAPGEVLVRVHGAGVGPWDAWVRSGRSALPQPLPLTLGSDVAGTIERVGSSPSPFAPGDAVYGVTNGRFTGGNAELAIAKEGMIALKPRSLDYVAAASIPVIAVTAKQMLFDQAGLSQGKRVLIHGAAGNVGSYAVRMARDAGMYVLATARPNEAAMVHAWGADEVIQLPGVPHARHLGSVDAAIDTIGGPSQRELFVYLRKGATLVSAVSPPDEVIAARHQVRGVFFLVAVTTLELTRLGELFDSHRLAPRVGEVLPLEAARQAHEMLESRRPRLPGKIVLRVGSD